MSLTEEVLLEQAVTQLVEIKRLLEKGQTPTIGVADEKKAPVEDDPEFTISFSDIKIKASEVWPTGYSSDKPKNPTPEDVIEAMKTYVGEDSPTSSIVEEWSLWADMYIDGIKAFKSRMDG